MVWSATALMVTLVKLLLLWWQNLDILPFSKVKMFSNICKLLFAAISRVKFTGLTPVYLSILINRAYATCLEFGAPLGCSRLLFRCRLMWPQGDSCRVAQSGQLVVKRDGQNALWPYLMKVWYLIHRRSWVKHIFLWSTGLTLNPTATSWVQSIHL